MVRELLNRRELAAALGVNAQTVTKWTAAGAPVAKRGRQGKPYLYEREAIEQWLQAREAAASNGKAVDLARERARKERAQALLAEQKYQERAGELLEADQVARVWSAQLNAVRMKLLSLPTRPQFASVAGQLEAAVRECLVELAEGSLEQECEGQQLCGAPTSTGAPCQNRAKAGGRCHIPAHQAA